LLQELLLWRSPLRSEWSSDDFGGLRLQRLAPHGGFGVQGLGLIVGVPLLVMAGLTFATAAGRAAPAWNAFGLANLTVAVTLGVTSSPGPLRIFTGDPSTVIMTELPWLLIPGFLVSLLMSTLFALFARLGDTAQAARLGPPPRDREPCEIV
jgi:hypothetical protein